MSYVDLVQDVVLGLLRASREGNWDLHINAIRNMIPGRFEYDKVKYARYLTTYFAQMTNLPKSHPHVYKYLKPGQFSLQLTSNYPFEKITVDQSIEVTVSKDTHTPTETAGFSLNTAAIK